MSSRIGPVSNGSGGVSAFVLRRSTTEVVGNDTIEASESYSNVSQWRVEIVGSTELVLALNFFVMLMKEPMSISGFSVSDTVG